MDQIQMTKLCTAEATLSVRMLGKMPTGTKIDISFSGTATGTYWEGERPIQGIDYTTSRQDGNLSLDILGTIGEGKELVSYRAYGVGVSESPTRIHPYEAVTFQTADPELEWLNRTVGVVVGTSSGPHLTLHIFAVKPPE